MNTKAIWRPTMSTDVVFELVDLLEQTKRTVGLSTNLRTFLSKLDSLAYDIGKGNRSPAYVATGTRTTTAISIESLGGGSQDEAAAQDHTLRDLSTASVTSSSTAPKPSADLTPEQEDEVAAMERAMLADLAAIGNPNVVLEDRRKTPRTQDTFDISQL
jgi:hypothetical protein